MQNRHDAKPDKLRTVKTKGELRHILKQTISDLMQLLVDVSFYRHDILMRDRDGIETITTDKRI